MNICSNCFQKLEEGVLECPHCGHNNKTDDYSQVLNPSSILMGKYIVGRVMGQGGFGITYKAINYHTREIVAIKEYYPDGLATRSQGNSVSIKSSKKADDFYYGRESFLGEAETIAKFRDEKGIIDIHEYFEENNTAYYVMGFLEGKDLKQYLREHCGRMQWDDLRKIMLPIMKALKKVHVAGIIHRDISPDNIFLTDKGSSVLLDFGAARASLGEKSQSLSVIMKKGFAPKEQYTSRGKQGPYTDIYALAATMYCCLTGCIPPEALDRHDWLHDEENTSHSDLLKPIHEYTSINPNIEAAILKALSIESKDRYQNVDDFMQALQMNIESADDVKDKTEQTESADDVKEETEQADKCEENKTDTQSGSTNHSNRNKKKIIIICAILAFVLLLVVGFVVFRSTHSHSYGEWEEIKAATCTEDGVLERKCSCGETEKKSIPALGHTVVTDAAVSATCTESGKTKGKHCSTCGAIIEKQESLPALEHKIVVLEAVEPTCTSEGKTEGSYCSVCNEVLVKQETLKKTDHKMVQQTAVEATCTQGGKSAGETCSVCGYTTQTDTPALGHSFSGYVCTRCGFQNGENCSTCGGSCYCTTCGGSGSCTSCLSEPGNCTTCHGEGQWTEEIFDEDGNIIKETLYTCDACNGSGLCLVCGGSARCNGCSGTGSCSACGGNGIR